MTIKTTNFNIFTETDLIVDIQDQMAHRCRIRELERGEFHSIYVGAYMYNDNILTIFYVPRTNQMFMVWDLILLKAIEEGDETYRFIKFNEDLIGKSIPMDNMMTYSILDEMDKNEDKDGNTESDQYTLPLSYLSFADCDQDLRKMCLDVLSNTWNESKAQAKFANDSSKVTKNQFKLNKYNKKA